LFLKFSPVSDLFTASNDFVDGTEQPENRTIFSTSDVQNTVRANKTGENRTTFGAL
jgi:hypothetical protein